MKFHPIALSLFLSLSGMLPGCVETADPNVPEAIAGCERPTHEVRLVTPRMLPGWNCQACHAPSGEADGLSWTASGTVFETGDAACNPGGVEGVKVELLGPNGEVLIALTTNKSGNFFTSETLPQAQFRARVSKDGRVQEMQALQGSTACASCHYPGGPGGGRIHL